MTQEQLEGSRMFLFWRTGMVGYLSLAFTFLGMGFLMMGAGKGCAETNPPETLEPVPHSFSVYALSRGKGVPEQAREVLVQSRTLLKAAQERGEVLRMVEQRIGIEGETRICAQFSNVEKALTMMDQIKKIGQGVDLVNVKAEPCPP